MMCYVFPESVRGAPKILQRVSIISGEREKKTRRVDYFRRRYGSGHQSSIAILAEDMLFGCFVSIWAAQDKRPLKISKICLRVI